MTEDHQDSKGALSEKKASFTLRFLRHSAASERDGQPASAAAVGTIPLDPPAVVERSSAGASPPAPSGDGTTVGQVVTEEVGGDPASPDTAQDDGPGADVVASGDGLSDDLATGATETPGSHNGRVDSQGGDLAGWVRQAEEAVARAKSTGSASSWKDVAQTAAAVYEVMRVTEAVVAARRDSQKKVGEADSAAAIARSSAQLALERMEVAREALAVSEELEKAVELARTANTLAAWREAARITLGNEGPDPLVEDAVRSTTS